MFEYTAQVKQESKLVFVEISKCLSVAFECLYLPNKSFESFSIVHVIGAHGGLKSRGYSSISEEGANEEILKEMGRIRLGELEVFQSTLFGAYHIYHIISFDDNWSLYSILECLEEAIAKADRA